MVSGVGAAGRAIIQLLHHQGFTDIIGCDRNGAIRPDNPNLDEYRRWIADTTNPRGAQGTLAEMLVGADVFIGVSAPNLLTGDDIAKMATRRSCSRWPTPTPRSTRSPPASTPRSWRPADRTTRTRSTTCWPFPGFFRGMLDSGAHEITDECLLAAATAIADCVQAGELNANYIVPSVFDPAVSAAVATAVRKATTR